MNNSGICLLHRVYALPTTTLSDLTVATTRRQRRACHFLPTHHLSIIPRSHVVPHSNQAMPADRQALQNGTLQTSNINFISGPSNSGDIELVSVVGVYRPLTVSYVVIDDASLTFE